MLAMNLMICGSVPLVAIAIRINDMITARVSRTFVNLRKYVVTPSARTRIYCDVCDAHLMDSKVTNPCFHNKNCVNGQACLAERIYNGHRHVNPDNTGKNRVDANEPHHNVLCEPPLADTCGQLDNAIEQCWFE